MKKVNVTHNIKPISFFYYDRDQFDAVFRNAKRIKKEMEKSHSYYAEWEATLHKEKQVPVGHPDRDKWIHSKGYAHLNIDEFLALKDKWNELKDDTPRPLSEFGQTKKSHTKDEPID